MNPIVQFMKQHLFTLFLVGMMIYTLTEQSPSQVSTYGQSLTAISPCDTCQAQNVSQIYKSGLVLDNPFSEPEVKPKPKKSKPASPAPKPVEVQKEEVQEEVQTKSQSTFKPLSVDITRNPGLRVKNLDRDELEEYLTRFYKMKNLEGKTLLELRRIWLAYAYDQFYWDVHERTGFPVSVIYAYFIMEATYQGLESDLMAKYRNPGGIKYHGIGSSTKAYDDCTDRKGRRIKCDFAVFNTYQEMVEGWSRIFNAERYRLCKSENTAGEICECLFRSGYHTGNNWNNRAGISKAYWEVRKSFPARD